MGGAVVQVDVPQQCLARQLAGGQLDHREAGRAVVRAGYDVGRTGAGRDRLPGPGVGPDPGRNVVVEPGVQDRDIAVVPGRSPVISPRSMQAFYKARTSGRNPITRPAGRRDPQRASHSVGEPAPCTSCSAMRLERAARALGNRARQPIYEKDRLDGVIRPRHSSLTRQGSLPSRTGTGTSGTCRRPRDSGYCAARLTCRPHGHDGCLPPVPSLLPAAWPGSAARRPRSTNTDRTHDVTSPLAE